MNSAILPPIPVETAKVACGVFGRSNFYMTVGDQANRLISGLFTEDAGGEVQKPARTLAMLYLITSFQFIETLPDQLAAQALRDRVDWKYALHLPLNYPGLEAKRLCEFRKELLSDAKRERNLQELLARLSEVTDLTGTRRSGLETEQVVSRVCMLSRLAKIWEGMSQALEAVATARPDLLRVISLPHWYERYSHQRKSLKLADKRHAQEVFAQAIGADGFYLLKAISRSTAPEMAELPEILALKQVWQEQYLQVEGELLWRKDSCAGCTLLSRCRCPIEWGNHGA